MSKSIKEKFIIFLFILMILLGLGIILYPLISNQLNERYYQKIIGNYQHTVTQKPNSQNEALLQEARVYNDSLTSTHIVDVFQNPNQEISAEYLSILNVNDEGMMGYISIPKIDVRIPIYHGTSAETIQEGVGHLEGSSFPVGGESTHAILSAHRGLPSSRLFTDLDQLKEGDIISVDCGVIWQGYHADAARTFPVGNISIENQKLIEDTKESFFEGIKDIKAGSRLGHISHKIQVYLESRGYGVVRELAGHGVGKQLHEDPIVANFGKYNSGIILQEGMTLAIEPMSTLGKRDVVLEDNDWTVSTLDGKTSAHYENTVLITKDGVEILTL